MSVRSGGSTGQFLLTLFVAFSSLPGMVALFFGGMIGLLGMVLLALFGMAGWAPQDRTPARMAGLWGLPTLVLVGLLSAFVLETIAATR